MSMVTQCPACGTRFRVTPQQLQAQEGKVRCGHCLAVFNGFERLASLPEPAAPAAAATAMHENEMAAGAMTAKAPEAQTPAASPAPPFVLESPPDFPEFAAEPEPPPQVETRTEPSPQIAAETAAQTRQAAIAAEEAVPAAAQQPPPAAAAPAETMTGQPQRSASSWLWALASVLALSALAAQAVYFYRSALASSHPGLRPMLTQMCSRLGCDVPLQQQPKLITVEASDLQIIDPARPNVIQLTATLRNRAGYDLAYPALDLVLTDSRDHTLARRIFLPAEYLERGKNVAAGIAASAEITIRLELDTGNLGAAGFRLGLLAAPA
ncbi:MAG: DUF3426 domain-containing protein [Burkholderiales bacterium]